MGATSLGKREALRYRRVDLAAAQKVDQHAEILPEPCGVAGHPADRPGSLLRSFAELLDLVLHHPPAGRKRAPRPDRRDRGVPLDHGGPALVAVLQRVVAAEHDEPATRPK